MYGKIQLTRGLLGWQLVPHYSDPDAGIKILDALYLDDWQKMSSKSRVIKDGSATAAEVVKHIKDAAPDCHARVSFCGNKERPIIRVWIDEPADVVKFLGRERSVDLKWGLWSSDKATWEQFAPGAWEEMRAAFNGTGPAIEIVTAPRKEIRCGRVVISKGQASGRFTCEWDDCESLAEVLGTVCDDAFRETVPFSASTCEPGTDWEFEIKKCRSFDSLMNKIDSEESLAIKHDDAEWTSLKACFANKS